MVYTGLPSRNKLIDISDIIWQNQIPMLLSKDSQIEEISYERERDTSSKVNWPRQMVDIYTER